MTNRASIIYFYTELKTSSSMEVDWIVHKKKTAIAKASEACQDSRHVHFCKQGRQVDCQSDRGGRNGGHDIARLVIIMYDPAWDKTYTSNTMPWMYFRN